MNKKEIVFVLVFNLIIAFGYYFQGLNAKIEDISSDLANIIPICKKIDNPLIYNNDLYLNDSSNVEYYTPFFVQSLRFLAKFVNRDYLQALNLLSFFTHFFYGVFWFLFFYNLKKNFWIAMIFSLFIRGIIWPPGGELLGISDLWTIMPRTVYSVFLPIPFLLYKCLNKYKLIAAALALGLIFNFHPITGIGGTVAYFSIFILFKFYRNELYLKKSLQEILLALSFCLLGMIPFLTTYLMGVESNLLFDHATFKDAFFSRIPRIFSDPLLFVFSWNRPILYLFSFLFILFYFFDTSTKKVYFKILFFSGLIVFLAANLSVYIEQMINFIFDKNIRMSFQLIRFQKLIIILLQIGIFLLVIELVKRLKLTSKIQFFIFILYFTVLICSSLDFIARLPFFGDDISTSVLPKNFKLKSNNQKNYDLSDMIDYVKNNTEKDAVFYGSYLVRAGADRAVVLDSKGAGMLIEGNPVKFIAWYKELQQFKLLNTEDKILFLRNKEVDYIIDEKSWQGLNPIKKIGKVYLYKIN